MKQKYLPFFDNRLTPIDMLIYHCSAQRTEEMIRILASLKLSCHYIVDIDGTITQIVPEEKRAWHAGLGFWRNIDTDINSHSIGIELCSPSLGQEAYPLPQIESLIKLSQDIIKRYNIKPQNIIGHSDSAPTRKADPGKAFPWHYLSKEKVGLWYDIKDAPMAPTSDLKQLLSGIGYDTRTPDAFQASQYAFARHFLPDLISINHDISYLLDNVYPPEIDFRMNEVVIAAAQAVYMRFGS